MKTGKSKFLSKASALLLTLVCAFGFLSQPLSLAASAAENWTETLTNQEYALTDWGYNFEGSGLPNAYNPIKAVGINGTTYSKGYTNDNFKWFHAYDFTYYIDGKGRLSYCLQLGIDSVDSAAMKKVDMNDSDIIEQFYDDETINLLKWASIYSYKLPSGSTKPSSASTANNKYGYTWEVELVASQIMMWAISSQVYFDDSKTALGGYEETLLSCVIAPSATRKAQVKECYKKMKADILSHKTLPKNTADVVNANTIKDVTYPLTYSISTGRWTATVASDAVMKQFDMAESVSGVTVTHSGNANYPRY